MPVKPLGPRLDVAVLQDRLQQCLGAGVRVKAVPQSGAATPCATRSRRRRTHGRWRLQAASALRAAAIDVILCGLPKQL